MSKERFEGATRRNPGTTDKSLFWNILRATILFSRFCADKTSPLSRKFNGPNILAKMGIQKNSWRSRSQSLTGDGV